MSMSHKLFREAQEYIPGGVNSPVRAWRAVGGSPLFIQRGRGCRVIDADGKEYLDYVGSWGPLIAGHAHPQVVRAVKEALKQGTSFGAPTAKEIELAKLIIEALPSIEKVRLTSSGTEATMTALRLARGYTGRTRIIKFAGCYHGHSDALLVRQVRAPSPLVCLTARGCLKPLPATRWWQSIITWRPSRRISRRTLLRWLQSLSSLYQEIWALCSHSRNFLPTYAH